MCDDDDLQRYTQQHLREKCGYLNMALMKFPFFAPAPLDCTHCMNIICSFGRYEWKIEKRNMRRFNRRYYYYLPVSKSVRNFSFIFFWWSSISGR